MVEYSSPNTNKPLHLGHLRNNFLGHSVSRIMENRGHTGYQGADHQRPRHSHLQVHGRVATVWKGETPETSGLKGDKLVGKYYVAFDQAYKAEVAELVEGGMAQGGGGKERAHSPRGTGDAPALGRLARPKPWPCGRP